MVRPVELELELDGDGDEGPQIQKKSVNADLGFEPLLFLEQMDIAEVGETGRTLSY